MPTLAARCLWQRFDFVPRNARHWCDDELGDAVEMVDRDRLSTVIDESDHDLAAVVRVDGPEDGDESLTRCEP
jgi:hypothetical protein